MLPLKWKIFRAVNVVHLAAVAIWLVWIFAESWSDLGKLLHDWTFVLFALCFPILFIINGVFNANLLERFYPDQLPGERFLVLHKIFYFLFLAMAICCVYGTFMLYYEFFIGYQPMAARRIDGKAAFLLFLVTTATATAIPITWLQIALRRTIRRNFNLSMDRFLDN